MKLLPSYSGKLLLLVLTVLLTNHANLSQVRTRYCSVESHQTKRENSTSDICECLLLFSERSPRYSAAWSKVIVIRSSSFCVDSPFVSVPFCSSLTWFIVSVPCVGEMALCGLVLHLLIPTGAAEIIRREAGYNTLWLCVKT